MTLLLTGALAMVSDYSCRLSVNETSPERKVGEFIKFLPVLAYDGSAMREVNAAEILDIAMAGTSATLLARRWESALLVNVDNDTLRRLLASPEAMKALMSIEGFRSLNDDIQTIINKSEAVKKAKKRRTSSLSARRGSSPRRRRSSRASARRSGTSSSSSRRAYPCSCISRTTASSA